LRVPKRSIALVALGIAACTASLAFAAKAGSPSNGNFETGTLEGWHTFIGSGGGTGRGVSMGTPWAVYKAGGLSGRQSGHRYGRRGSAPPEFTNVPQGKYAAAAYSSGGPRFLYRNLHLKPNRKITLSMKVFYRNFANVFYSPKTFDNFTETKNQQYRIDVIREGADIESLKDADVLKNVFRTRPGDKAKRGPFAVKANLSSLAGKTVTLRLAETDNQFYFYPGVDAVHLQQAREH
jgi:hypothetical protein